MEALPIEILQLVSSYLPTPRHLKLVSHAWHDALVSQEQQIVADVQERYPEAGTIHEALCQMLQAQDHKMLQAVAMHYTGYLPVRWEALVPSLVRDDICSFRLFRVQLERYTLNISTLVEAACIAGDEDAIEELTVYPVCKEQRTKHGRLSRIEMYQTFPESLQWMDLEDILQLAQYEYRPESITLRTIICKALMCERFDVLEKLPPLRDIVWTGLYPPRSIQWLIDNGYTVSQNMRAFLADDPSLLSTNFDTYSLITNKYPLTKIRQHKREEIFQMVCNGKIHTRFPVELLDSPEVISRLMSHDPCLTFDQIDQILTVLEPTGQLPDVRKNMWRYITSGDRYPNLIDKHLNEDNKYEVALMMRSAWGLPAALRNYMHFRGMRPDLLERLADPGPTPEGVSRTFLLGYIRGAIRLDYAPALCNMLMHYRRLFGLSEERVQLKAYAREQNAGSYVMSAISEA